MVRMFGREGPIQFFSEWKKRSHESSLDALRIEVVLRGGLGNQLFGFCAGFELARKLELPLHLQTGNLFRPGDTPRSFELSQIADGWVTWGHHGKKQKIFREKSFAYDPSFESISGPVTLDGYFQSSRYFTYSWPEIRERILDATDFQTGSQKTPEDFLAVQVRRGDYLRTRQREFHGLVPREFFFSSVNYLRAIAGDLPVIIFSDDAAEAANVASEIPNAYPYTDFGAESPLSILGALSNAAGLAISNSSFGWWGALLSAPGAPIIVPRPWFQDRSVDTTDLFETHWLSLGTY